MSELTISVPVPGTKAVFEFKEPFRSYVKNTFRFNTNSTRMEVLSVISMKDNVVNDARDPFSKIYDPAGLTQEEYKKDVVNGIPIISLKFEDKKGVTKYLRVPASYISSITETGVVEYIDKMLVIDLGSLPIELDVVSPIVTIVRDVLSDLLGVVDNTTGLPKIHEVSVGNIEMVPYTEHELREQLREQTQQLDHHLETSSEFWKARYDQLVDYLDANNIWVNLDGGQ